MVGKKIGRLKVIKKVKSVIKNGRSMARYLCKCDCGNNFIAFSAYLRTKETQSCGCLKKDLENKHLREKYDKKRINGVAMHLFTQKPRKDNSLGYKGVQKYYTRKNKKERYRAYITVDGKTYKKAGFLTAEDAYYNGRLVLERKYLPRQNDRQDDR